MPSKKPTKPQTAPQKIPPFKRTNTSPLTKHQKVKGIRNYIKRIKKSGDGQKRDSLTKKDNLSNKSSSKKDSSSKKANSAKKGSLSKKDPQNIIESKIEKTDPSINLLSRRFSHRPYLRLCDITHLLSNYIDPRTRLSIYDKSVLYYVGTLGVDQVKSVNAVKMYGNELYFLK